MLLSYLISRLKSRGLVAIDWSDCFLHVVVLRKKADRQYALIVADSAELKCGVIENGQIIDFAEVAESLLVLLKRNKIKHKKVVFVLNSDSVITKRLRFDEGLTESQVHNELMLDFDKHVSYPLEETFYDFELQTKSENIGATKQEVTFIAAHKDQIGQYQQLARLCRLTVEVIDVDSYALQRYVEIFYPEDKSQCWALICLNHKRFKLHIFDDVHIYATEHKSVSVDLDDGDYLNTLSAWLMRNLQMFEVSNPGKNLDKVVLYGDRVEIDNLSQIFRETMQLEVLILDPFIKLSNSNQTTKVKHKASYLLVVGLATRSEVS